MAGAAPSKEVCVNPDTRNPDLAWKKLSRSQTVRTVTDLLPLNTPVYDDKVRFVCVSDTHNAMHKLCEIIPPGDVLLHAGDFTYKGGLKEVEKFNDSLGTLKHKHKIVIAGNHELTFDGKTCPESETKSLQHNYGLQHMSDVLTNCMYLQDSSTTVYGLKIYGSPWQPEFCDWAFNLERGQECLDKWNLIPDDVDILMTHGPPIGHGDMCKDGQRAGCVELLETIQKRVRPQYHLYGHIHEGYGVTTDGVTTFINASNMTARYQLLNKPIIFDISLPEGITKS